MKNLPKWWPIAALLLLGGCWTLAGTGPEPVEPVVAQVKASPALAEQPDPKSVKSAAFDRDAFLKVANSYFSPAYTEDITANNVGAAEVYFKLDPEYFETGDKINKIAAIESARLFRESEGLNKLQMFFQTSDGGYEVVVTRDQIEDYYGQPFEAGMNWEGFISQFDNEDSRADFAEEFVVPH